MRIIDAHCHVGQGKHKQQTAAELLRSMDENQVERAVIVPVDEHIAFHNESGNAAILELVKSSGGRFAGFAVVNPWSGRQGLDMVRRYLDAGLRGVKLNTALHGLYLFDELVCELVAGLRDYPVPFFVHTGTPIYALPMHLRELAREFPATNFIMGHMGSYDFVSDYPRAIEGLRNIYLDTSLTLSNFIKGAVATAGADRVIFGSDSPRSTQKFELENVLRAIDDPEVLDQVLYRNIGHLLGG
jgi:predicted TIM-barrel fold metal-dependent hydrolase